MKKIYFIFAALITIVQYSYGASNSIIIKELDGVTTNNYPVQLARPFKKGEIVNYPQAFIGTTALVTQADVKQRWEDGTVKHAIITFYIPTLTANSTITISFQNQAIGNNTGLNTTDMLAAAYNFDATIDLTKNAQTISASARTMLQNNDYTYWMQGTNATSIVLADHSMARIYDIGYPNALSQNHRAFRPIFHATFFPLINKVRVRIIGEIANTLSYQDIKVDSVRIKTGATSPLINYRLPSSKSPLKMLACSRWTKEYWIGGEPSRISIDHNLPYLIENMFFPNYDLSKSFSGSSYAMPTTDLYDKGALTPYMGAVAGRPEIGLYTAWTLRWMYTMNKDDQDFAMGHAQLASAWPIHFREGDDMRNGSTRYFDKAQTIPALGKPLSLNARPTFQMYLGILKNSNAVPADQIVATDTFSWSSNAGNTNPNTTTPWSPDQAHSPGFFIIEYMLSGDFYYLEELQFWASYDAFYSSPANRGPTYTEGGIIDAQTRGDAWIIRNRARAAYISPDNAPEQNYFTSIVNGALAIWEGQRNITGTPLSATPEWTWARTNQPQQNNPLHFWTGAEQYASIAPGDITKTSRIDSPWMANFVLSSLGMLKEMGFESSGLLSWFSQNLIGQITNPSYDPYLSSAYRIPVIDKSTNTFYQDWASVKNAYQSSFNSQNDFNAWGNGDTYPLIAMCASSFAADQPNGTVAWNWLSTKVLTKAAGFPIWAVLPRQKITTEISKNIMSTENLFSIYPNPTTDRLSVNYISDEASKIKLKIFNITGDLVFQNQIVTNELTELNLENLPAGVYFVQCINNIMVSETKKFTVIK